MHAVQEDDRYQQTSIPALLLGFLPYAVVECTSAENTAVYQYLRILPS